MTAYPQDVKSILLSMLTYDGIKQEISGRAKELGSLLLRRNPQRPAVFVGTATCGLGAGAGHTLAAVREFLKWHNVDAEVVETGCRDGPASPLRAVGLFFCDKREGGTASFRAPA